MGKEKKKPRAKNKLKPETRLVDFNRWYRPRKWVDLIGQQDVVAPLKQSIAKGWYPTQILLSGPAGTGKTSTARIIASCLNCEKGPTVTPCGQCDTCKNVKRGGRGITDEFDIPQYSGPKGMRELEARLSTGGGFWFSYRVAVLDEVHGLGKLGFATLLKSLEEPPAEVVFVLATTEPEMLPPTITSRCAAGHYRFRLVPSELMIPHLMKIAEAEGFKPSTKRIEEIAVAAAGSPREAVGRLQQLLGTMRGGTK